MLSDVIILAQFLSLSFESEEEIHADAARGRKMKSFNQQ
jgi:hypothetical protein